MGPKPRFTEDQALEIALAHPRPGEGAGFFYEVGDPSVSWRTEDQQYVWSVMFYLRMKNGVVDGGDFELVILDSTGKVEYEEGWSRVYVSDPKAED